MSLLGVIGDIDYFSKEFPEAEIDGIMNIMRACGYENAVGTSGQENGNETLFPYVTKTIRSELEALRPVIVKDKRSNEQTESWRAWLLHEFNSRRKQQ